MVNVYTQLLMRRHVGENPQAEEYAAHIHEGVHRMEALIHDLLTFSRTSIFRRNPHRKQTFRPPWPKRCQF